MSEPEVLPGGSLVDGAKPGETKIVGGKRVKKATVKQLKKMLKKAGLKTTGKRAALTRRAHKAHLKMKGGSDGEVVKTGGGSFTPMPIPTVQGGGRRRSRRRSQGNILGVKLY